MLVNNGVALNFTESAVDFLSDADNDSQFGARLVKRAIPKYVLNELPKEILGMKIDRSCPIINDREGDGLVF